MCIYARNKLKAYKSLDVRGQVQDIIFYNNLELSLNIFRGFKPEIPPPPPLTSLT